MNDAPAEILEQIFTTAAPTYLSPMWPVLLRLSHRHRAIAAAVRERLPPPSILDVTAAHRGVINHFAAGSDCATHVRGIGRFDPGQFDICAEHLDPDNLRAMIRSPIAGLNIVVDRLAQYATHLLPLIWAESIATGRRPDFTSVPQWDIDIAWPSYAKNMPMSADELGQREPGRARQLFVDLIRQNLPIKLAQLLHFAILLLPQQCTDPILSPEFVEFLLNYSTATRDASLAVHSVVKVYIERAKNGTLINQEISTLFPQPRTEWIDMFPPDAQRDIAYTDVLIDIILGAGSS